GLRGNHQPTRRSKAKCKVRVSAWNSFRGLISFYATMNKGDKKQMEWGTRVGVILAVSGSAVGLGNFLRFPGQAVAHGGGAFMIPYVCALLFLDLSIGWAVWSLVRYGGRL